MPWAKRPASAKYRNPAHKAARAALLAMYRQGDACCLCGHPMIGPTRWLHADHVPGTLDQYRGLAHGGRPCEVCGIRCNPADGARRARARQEATKLTW